MHATDKQEKEKQEKGEDTYIHTHTHTHTHNKPFMCFATAPHPAFLAVDVKYYLRDLSKLLALINDGPTKSFAFRRIHFLLNKFTLHTMLNSTRELSQCHPPPNMQPLCECVCVCLYLSVPVFSPCPSPQLTQP